MGSFSFPSMVFFLPSCGSVTECRAHSSTVDGLPDSAIGAQRVTRVLPPWRALRVRLTESSPRCGRMPDGLIYEQCPTALTLGA